MTEETLTTVKVIAPTDRYRRAGLGFSKGENTLEVTPNQIRALYADTRLKVSVMQDQTATQPGESSGSVISLDLAGVDEEVAPWVAIIHEAVNDGSLKMTAANVPDIKTLETSVEEPAGVKLTADIRDAAWAEYQRLTAGAE